MSVNTFLNSHAFRLFIDEPLRHNACQAVELFLEDHQPVDNVQLHAIASVIQAGGVAELRKLIDNQKEKNTKLKNRKFWEFLWKLLFENPGEPFALRPFLEANPAIHDLMEMEPPDAAKRELRRIRKANRKLLEGIIDSLLLVYFEHFNCHYFYTRRGYNW